jgi:hypothetical protein
VKKPSVRVTKWLGDIPVEGACTSCASVRFQIKPLTHRPNREEYRVILQRAFDQHFRHVHVREDASQDSDTARSVQ